MKIELDIRSLYNTKVKIINYLVKVGYIKTEADRKEILDRLNRVEHFYVEDLLKNGYEAAHCAPDHISIDKSFFELSADGKRVIKVKDEHAKGLALDICHEMWHAATRKDNRTVGIEKSAQYTSLNEGLTQMFAEETCGVEVSKYSDTLYRYYKYITRIMMLSTSKNTVLSSFVGNTDDLEKAINKLANNDVYFQDISYCLSEFNYKLTKTMAAEAGKTKAFSPAVGKVITPFLADVYDSVILNIVMPKLKSLNRDEKKKYITDLLMIFKDDYEMYKKVSDYFSYVIGMDDLSLSKERVKVSEKLYEMKKNLIFLNRFFEKKGELFEKNTLNVRNDGTIGYSSLDGYREITDPDLRELVYKQLYLIHPAFNFDLSNFDSYKGRTFKFHSNSNILEKRKFFCGLKMQYENHGYHVLNSPLEFDDIDTVKPLVVKKENIPSISELNMFRYHFGSKEVYNNGHYDIVFFNRKTGEENKTGFVKKTMRFIKLWEKACISQNMNGFTEELTPFYDNIMNTMRYYYYNEGKLNVQGLIDRYRNDPKHLGIIQRLFASKESYEIMYEYMNSYIDAEKKRPVMQFQKEKSIEERLYGDYEISEKAIDLSRRAK